RVEEPVDRAPAQATLRPDGARPPAGLSATSLGSSPRTLRRRPESRDHATLPSTGSSPAPRLASPFGRSSPRCAVPPNASVPCRPACGSLPPAVPLPATRRLEDRPSHPSSPAVTRPRSPTPPPRESRGATRSACLPPGKGAPGLEYFASLRRGLDRLSPQPSTSGAGPMVPPPPPYMSPHERPAQRIGPWQSSSPEDFSHGAFNCGSKLSIAPDLHSRWKHLMVLRLAI